MTHRCCERGRSPTHTCTVLNSRKDVVVDPTPMSGRNSSLSSVRTSMPSTPFPWLLAVTSCLLTPIISCRVQARKHQGKGTRLQCLIRPTNGRTDCRPCVRQDKTGRQYQPWCGCCLNAKVKSSQPREENFEVGNAGRRLPRPKVKSEYM